MSDFPKPEPKLFLLREIASKEADLDRIKRVGNFRIYNYLDQGNGMFSNERFFGGGEREFSVPSGAIPVYVYLADSWEEVEKDLKRDTFFRSRDSNHLIVGEVSIQLVNSGEVQLSINTPFSRARGRMDVRVTIERGVATISPEEASQLVPELKGRINYEGEKPFFDDKDNREWLGEGYIMDPDDVMHFKDLSEVRIYEEKPDGVDLRYHMRSGEVIFSTEGNASTNTESKA